MNDITRIFNEAMSKDLELHNIVGVAIGEKKPIMKVYQLECPTCGTRWIRRKVKKNLYCSACVKANGNKQKPEYKVKIINQ